MFFDAILIMLNKSIMRLSPHSTGKQACHIVMASTLDLDPITTQKFVLYPT